MRLLLRSFRTTLRGFLLSSSLWTSVAAAQQLDYRYNGMWYQPELAGHGFNLVVQSQGDDSRVVFVSFFSYDDSGQANFYAGNVTADAWALGEALEIPMHQASGGGFSMPSAVAFDDPQRFADAGTLSLRLFSCGQGHIAYALRERTSGELVTSDYRVEKLIGVPLEVCREGLPRGALERRSRMEFLEHDDYRYFVYVPSAYEPTSPRPLIIALHGAAGPGRAAAEAERARDLWQEIAEEEGFIVLAQVGTSPNGSWFPSVAHEIMGRLLQELATDYAIDERRIYGWGFSAGGHTMHAIALENTDLFAGYAVNAGVLNAVLGRDALGAVDRKIPVSSLVGTADPLLAEARGDRDAFLQRGWVSDDTLFYREFDGGHTVRPDFLAEHWEKLRSFVLPGVSRSVK